MKRFTFLGIISLVVVLVWSLSFLTVSCTNDDDDDDTPTPTPTQPPATPTVTPTWPPEGNQVGNRGPNFTLNDRNETPHTLWNYEGDVILLDLSAMWCGPCQSEAKNAEALYQYYKDRGFIILSVLISDYQYNKPDAADCASWADRFGLTFPVLYDPDRVAWNLYNTEGYIPLNVILDRNMVIRYTETGYNENAIKNMIESLL